MSILKHILLHRLAITSLFVLAYLSQGESASEITDTVSNGALNSTHSLTPGLFVPPITSNTAVFISLCCSLCSDCSRCVEMLWWRARVR